MSIASAGDFARQVMMALSVRHGDIAAGGPDFHNLPPAHSASIRRGADLRIFGKPARLWLE
jgi:hypothetical protein